MRRLALNLLTSSAAFLLLVVLTAPFVRTGDEPLEARSARAAAPAQAVRALQRVFGVYVDPWHVDDWARAVSERPQLVAKFEAFSRNRTIENHIAEAERQGVRQLLVSWEPWKPVPAKLGGAAQAAPQPGYLNRKIARGAHDDYIRRFARSLRSFKGRVYLRYAHEMNGFWYPWFHQPHSYRVAWRRVWRIFRREGVRNVRFVWSLNPNLYERPHAFLSNARRYWPGKRYVDEVGSTMINFGGEKDYTVERVEPRLRLMRRAFRKPMVLTETNTEFATRLRWLRNLRRMLRRTPWIRTVVWSQLPSRARKINPKYGNVDWDVQRDPKAAAVLRRIIHDLQG
jgi:mannan endo-1,4-beta-mannosidase